MSEFTKVLHRKNYPAIDAASPEQSQTGRKVLITGGTEVIGYAAAQGFVTAGADVVAITSRNAEKAAQRAKELEAAAQGHTKVRGYQYENNDEASTNALWDNLERDGIQIDVLILNATENIPTAQQYEPSAAQFFKAFESGVKNQVINVRRFQNQGAKEGKVLIYVSSNNIHFHELPEYYSTSSSSRIAMTRMVQDLATIVPVNKMQILCVFPGLIATPGNAIHGYTGLPWDDPSLPGNFWVWAATKKAAFLHGRFVWSNWDVDELMEMKLRFEADQGLLKVGVQGLVSQDFNMLIAGMLRSV